MADAKEMTKAMGRGSNERERGDGGLFVCLMLLCILAKSKVISGPVPTCDSAHLW